MDISHADVVEASSILLDQLGVNNGCTVVRLSHIEHKDYSPRGGCLVLKIAPQRLLDTNDDTVFLHPVLYDYLTAVYSSSASLLDKCTADCEPSVVNNPVVRCSIAPFPFDPSTIYRAYDTDADDLANVASHHVRWNLSVISVNPLPDTASLSVTILYTDIDDIRSTDSEHVANLLAMALSGRIVAAKSVSLLLTHKGSFLVMVEEILLSATDDQRVDENSLVSYHVSSAVNATMLRISHLQQGNPLHKVVTTDLPLDIVETCPGYESTFQTLLQLLKWNQSDPVAPTGVTLSGCAGVGKTRMAECIMNHFRTHSPMVMVKLLSLPDLLLKAAWMTPNDILPRTLFRSPHGDRGPILVIIDDLHAIQDPDTNSQGTYNHQVPASNDTERRVIWNAMIQLLETAAGRPNVVVLGLTTGDSHTLPPEWTRIGRLEKEICMDPPTQRQREAILCHLLEISGMTDPQQTQQWAERIAATTPGCVAGDLHKLFTDAWTRARACNSESLSWSHLREATNQCIPSQLVQLDVIKPPSTAIENHDDWAGRHWNSWTPLAGYEMVKKRVYRTVVLPWKRTMNQKPTVGISPPSGVVFYGPSGCGKTLAAGCLAASLGLPMIKVRAADVLDKWLGGSEAAIRSLFARARSASPCILFFDEIDAIASNRSLDGDTVDVMSRLLSTLLNELDGIASGESKQVLVVACTNRLESLDAALIRPGRLEEHVALDKPTVTDAQEIIKQGLGRAILHKDLNIAGVADQLVRKGASGAQIEGVGRDAVLCWIRSNQESALSEHHIREAMSAMNI